VGGANVTVSLPHLIGGTGVFALFPPVLAYEEEESLHASAGVVRQAIKELDTYS
jgi:malate/lactate dehydrogenase